MAESQPLSAAPEGAEYLRAVLRAPVYEAVQKTPLQKMDKLSSRLDNVILVKREDPSRCIALSCAAPTR